ncbi:MAG: hypothetical protein JWM90_2278, partial [Thermoleophilia bacterium]|nr:hypothetical protein [Thermoleophilia bacterium]
MTRIAGGWITPAKPGPTRRDVLLLVGVAATLFLLWSLFGTGWLTNRGDDDKRVDEVVLQLEPDGTIRAATNDGDAADATWPIEVRSRAGVRFFVARSRGEVTDTSGPLRISVDVPAGVARAAPTLRVLAPGHRVRLRRDKDEVPTALVDDFTPGDELTVMVTLPARQLRGLSDVGPEGELDAVTRPFDDAIAGNRDDQAKLRRLRGDAWWLALLGIVVTALVPLFLWRRARVDFLRIGAIPAASTKLPTGPPGKGHAVDAAVLTRGTRGVDPASAFAGHVLDMVGREQVRLRRTLDPREGSGVRFGIASASALEQDT